MENGTKESSGMGDLFSTRTDHVQENHVAYFAKWDKLIDMERKDAQSMRKEIWSMSSKEREQLGR